MLKVLPIENSVHFSKIKSFPGYTKTGALREVGLEIEFEAGPSTFAGIMHGFVSEHFKIVNDPSLRNGAEIVFEGPKAREDVYKTLERIEETLLKKFNYSFAEEATFGYRTSTHVHINVQDLTPIQLFNFITFYLIFEVPLLNIFSPERVGNVFCLRGIDGAIDWNNLLGGGKLEKFLHYVAINDNLKYGSINLWALTRPSLEFRSLGGTKDFQKITNWVNVLLSLKDLAKTVKTPAEIFKDFSGNSFKKYMDSIFGLSLEEREQLYEYYPQTSHSGLFEDETYSSFMLAQGILRYLPYESEEDFIAGFSIKNFEVERLSGIVCKDLKERGEMPQLLDEREIFWEIPVDFNIQ